MAIGNGHFCALLLLGGGFLGGFWSRFDVSVSWDSLDVLSHPLPLHRRKQKGQFWSLSLLVQSDGPLNYQVDDYFVCHNFVYFFCCGCYDDNMHCRQPTLVAHDDAQGSDSILVGFGARAYKRHPGSNLAFYQIKYNTSSEEHIKLTDVDLEYTMILTLYHQIKQDTWQCCCLLETSTYLAVAICHCGNLYWGESTLDVNPVD